MSDLLVFFIVVLVIWLGIGGYVFYLHKKIDHLEKELNKLKE